MRRFRSAAAVSTCVVADDAFEFPPVFGAGSAQRLDAPLKRFRAVFRDPRDPFHPYDVIGGRFRTPQTVGNVVFSSAEVSFQTAALFGTPDPRGEAPERNLPKRLEVFVQSPHVAEGAEQNSVAQREYASGSIEGADGEARIGAETDGFRTARNERFFLD